MQLRGRVAPPPCPPPVRGFEKVHRYWDPSIERWTAKVLPGEYYVTRADEAIVTVLGSCIAACIADHSAGCAGMNHFMLPEKRGGSGDDWLDPASGFAMRYGSYAMECLINELLKLGATRENLEIKLFGAGCILASMTDIGALNASFVRAYLESEGLPTLAEDLGGIHPRRIVFFPVTGRVRVRRLRSQEATAVAASERRYQGDITRQGLSGDVELFD